MSDDTTRWRRAVEDEASTRDEAFFTRQRARVLERVQRAHARRWRGRMPALVGVATVAGGLVLALLLDPRPIGRDQADALLPALVAIETADVPPEPLAALGTGLGEADDLETLVEAGFAPDVPAGPADGWFGGDDDDDA